MKYRMNHAVSPVDNPMKMLRDMRRGIAWIHTELTKRAKAETVEIITGKENHQPARGLLKESASLSATR